MSRRLWVRGFVQGYACALACIVKEHGEDQSVVDAYSNNFHTVEELLGYGCHEGDVEILKPIIRQIEGKTK